MTDWNEPDLRDPSPPVPGERERAAVAARAHELGRRRRILQGAGALGMVAALAVGVAALTAGGSSSGSGTNRIEAASSSSVPATTAAPTTLPAPTTAAPTTTVAPPPTPAPDGADVAAATTPPAPQPEAPPAPVLGTVSGTVSNIPSGVTVTVSLSGPGGDFSTIVDGSGHYAIAGVPAGTYTGMYEWENADRTSTGVGRAPVTVNGDTTVDFAVT